MKYIPRQRKLVLEVLEDRHALGVCFGMDHFASDSPIFNSIFRHDNRILTSLVLSELSIIHPGNIEEVSVDSHFDYQQVYEPMNTDCSSDFSFVLTELNGVLKNGSDLPESITNHANSRMPFRIMDTQRPLGNDSEVDCELQRNAGLNGPDSESIPIYISLAGSDALYSWLNSTNKISSHMKGEPTPNWGQTEHGAIRIDCTTTPSTGGNPEGILGANDQVGTNSKLDPGWYSNVNWSADWDSKNGWNPGTTKTTTAGNTATYQPRITQGITIGTLGAC